MKFKSKKAIMAAALSAIVAANSFSMVVSAEESRKYYSVLRYVSNSNLGSLDFDKNKAAAGETVTIIPKPNEGCRVDALDVWGATLNGNQFTMPENDVTVYVRFVKIDSSETTPPESTPTPDPTPTLNWKKGDANCDGKVTAEDATAVLKHLAGIMELSYIGSVNADMDQNGKVTAADATAILKLLVGKT